MKLGEKIRYLREVEGSLRGLGRAMSQQELVRAIEAETGSKLSQSYLSQIESGARPLTIDAAISICEEYGLTLDWLFRGDRSMLPHHLALEIARIEAAEL